MNFFRWVWRSAFRSNDGDGTPSAMIEARETTKSLVGRLHRERTILQARIDKLENDAKGAQKQRRTELAKQMMKRRRLLVNELENIEKRLLNIEQANMEISAMETNRDMIRGMEQINQAAVELQNTQELSLDRLDRVTDQWQETQETNLEISDRLTSPDLFLNPDAEGYNAMMGADDNALLEELDALIALEDNDRNNNNNNIVEQSVYESPDPATTTATITAQRARPRRVLAEEFV